MRYVFLSLLMLSSLAAQTERVLVITPAGYFVGSMVDGKPPSQWFEIDHVWTVDGNGEPIPPVPTDKIADQVDAWSDDANDPVTRLVLSSCWRDVIKDVEIENNNVTIENADRHLSACQGPIVELLPADKRAAWVLWSQKVAALIDSEKQRGTYSLKTLQSIHAGLVRK